MKPYTEEKNMRPASEHHNANNVSWAELCSIYERARTAVDDEDEMPDLSKLGYLVRDARSSRSRRRQRRD